MGCGVTTFLFFFFSSLLFSLISPLLTIIFQTSKRNIMHTDRRTDRHTYSLLILDLSLCFSCPQIHTLLFCAVLSSAGYHLGASDPLPVSLTLRFLAEVAQVFELLAYKVSMNILKSNTFLISFLLMPPRKLNYSQKKKIRKEPSSSFSYLFPVFTKGCPSFKGC